MPTTTVTLEEFSADAARFVRAASRGETVVVTEAGAPLATVSDSREAERIAGRDLARKLGADWGGGAIKPLDDAEAGELLSDRLVSDLVMEMRDERDEALDGAVFGRSGLAK